MGQNSIMSVLLMMSIAWQSIGTSLPGRNDPIAVERKAFKIQHPGKTGKIVGGVEAVRHSWPFLVAITKQYGDSLKFHCGGSIIDESHILSAAHCFKNPNFNFFIIAGEHNFSAYDDKEQIVRVDRIVLHPNYTASQMSNDVAILKLIKPLQLNETASAAILSSTCPAQIIFKTVGCEVAGWGGTQKVGGTSSDVLLEAQITLHSNQTCRSQIEHYGNDQLCAGEPNIHTCLGDSGGPLLCPCEGQKQVVGVVSYGYGCGLQRHPGGYAKVSYFFPWIYETVPIM